MNETAFFNAILKFAETQLCVDTSRVFLSGFSTGAFLALGLGCKFAGTSVRGVAADAGSLGLLYLEECRNGYPLPIVNFHSKSDPTIPYDGELWIASQEEVNAVWRQRNGCNRNSSYRITFKSGTTECRRYDCPGAPVEMCAVEGLDHCWIGGRSGGFPTCVPRNDDIDATNHLLEIFEEF